ncbi:hypothetical protein [Alicyclobacillus herbarius]|uniref:hypothetical protein n=1 Tax=Alicyclobacillus herbarius TaxID=122960 RepID=UPI00041D66A4|nr:hypothetical protein [Alicyclobacillus herbarius]
MRVREHFLLGTEMATISVTAKRECRREDLFLHVMEAIVSRYQEEFGLDARERLLAELVGKSHFGPLTWRLRPEDSCWSHAEKLGLNTDATGHGNGSEDMR